MLIYAIDDERLALGFLVNILKEAAPEAEIVAFTEYVQLLEAMDKRSCDIAFLDIQLRGMNGLELAKLLMTKKPNLNIIFVTGYKKYMEEAWKMLASGYITKPVHKEDIIDQLQGLRYKICEARPRAQTFGNFTLFYKGQVVSFHRKKSKECLAYLIDRRGTVVTRTELSSVLFDDGFYDSNRQKYIGLILKSLADDLEAAGIKDLLCFSKGYCYINKDRLDCDLFDYLEGRLILKEGTPYMAEYSWGEYFPGNKPKK